MPGFLLVAMNIDIISVQKDSLGVWFIFPVVRRRINVVEHRRARP